MYVYLDSQLSYQYEIYKTILNLNQKLSKIVMQLPQPDFDIVISAIFVTLLISSKLHFSLRHVYWI